MKRVLSLVAVAFLAIGGLTLVGCASNSQAGTGSRDSGFAGGNGAFGESPESPGTYDTGRPASSTLPPSDDTGR